MRRRCLTLTALGLAVVLQIPLPASAQRSDVATAQERSTNVPVNVGLVPYVDVNTHFLRPRNNFSLDALVGMAWRVEGVAIAGLSGFVRDGMRGVQLGGLSGYVGGDFTGVQLTGLLGATRGTATGLQLSGVVNTAGGVRGAQIGVVNVGGGSVTGLQLSGVVNQAERISGAQIGLVNVGGKVKGLQLGLVNVADEVEGAAIGLFNFVRKDGRHSLDLWTSDTAAFELGTKLGTKHIYSIVGMGLQRARGATAWMPTLGLGGSIPIGDRAFSNIEALASLVNIGSEWDENSVLVRLRLVGGYRFNDRLGLFAGPVLNIFRSSSGKRLADISYLSTLGTRNEGGAPIDFGVGFVVGLQAF